MFSAWPQNEKIIADACAGGATLCWRMHRVVRLKRREAGLGGKI